MLWIVRVTRWIGLTALFSGLGACGGVPPEEFHRIELLLGQQTVGTVADIGAGGGEHLGFYSRLVGVDGQVFATELEPELVDGLKRLVAAEGFDNVRVVQASAASTGLPEACCDLVVLRHVYHHLTQPEATLADIHRSLRPHGRLLLIDFQPTLLLAPWTPDDLPEDRSGHGVTPAIIIREGEAAGFRKLSTEQDWPGGHLLMDRFSVLLAKVD